MRYILAAWCSEGFECLQDITDLHPDNFEKGQIMEALRGNTPQANPLFQQISHMRLRARFNSQREYEIYVFTLGKDVEFKDVEDWMIADPQSLVEWIRINYWSKIHSDYHRKHNRIV